MQYVACVKLVGIELAVILPVQYDIRKCSSWTRYRRGRGVSAVRCHGDLCTLAIPDRRLDAPDLMSGTHITGHAAGDFGPR